jgi:hypothetical protein
MNSYPASCDFMVARPPTYNESMEHFSRIQNNRHRPIVISQNSGNNRPIVISQNSKKLRKSLCNIL